MPARSSGTSTIFLGAALTILAWLTLAGSVSGNGPSRFELAERKSAMSTADSIHAVRVICQPKVNPWIIAVVVSLAAFMEVLDMSIANVALPHIAGGVAASNDEGTWVLTSYLIPGRERREIHRTLLHGGSTL